MRERYGQDYFHKIGAKGGKASGKKGALTAIRRYGDDHFQKIGSKGGKARKKAFDQKNKKE